MYGVKQHFGGRGCGMDVCIGLSSIHTGTLSMVIVPATQQQGEVRGKRQEARGWRLESEVGGNQEGEVKKTDENCTFPHSHSIFSYLNGPI